MNADPQALRRNEQLKAAAGVMTNLGTGLIAASAARWFGYGVDAIVLLWLLAAALMIWSGIHMLTALEAEQGYE